MNMATHRTKRDCHPSQFRCQNGACISMDLRCNGIVDCLSDAYDELNCQRIASGNFNQTLEYAGIHSHHSLHEPDILRQL